MKPKAPILLQYPISRRSFIKSAGISAALAPFVPYARPLNPLQDTKLTKEFPQVPYGVVYFRKIQSATGRLGTGLPPCF